MAKSKAPRKKYVPKPNDPVNIRFSAEDELNFQLMPHTELLKMRNGAGTDESWDTLEMRLKWGQALAKLKGLADIQGNLAEALSKLIGVHERYSRINQYGLSGEENTAIGQGLALTDELQLSASRRELRDTLNQALAFMKKAPQLSHRLNCFVAG